MAPASRPAARADSVFFYAGWPLGYHNQEAERKARAFAATGRDVVWVTSVGFRNPRLSSAGKLGDRVLRKLTSRGRPGAPSGGPTPIRTAGVLVAPPRQLPAVRAANTAWMARQLRG